MTKYTVSVSADRTDTAPKADEKTPIVLFYEVEAETPTEAGRIGVDAWKVERRTADGPLSVGVASIR
jgi:hypothetical protein